MAMNAALDTPRACRHRSMEPPVRQCCACGRQHGNYRPATQLRTILSAPMRRRVRQRHPAGTVAQPQHRCIHHRRHAQSPQSAPLIAFTACPRCPPPRLVRHLPSGRCGLRHRGVRGQVSNSPQQQAQRSQGLTGSACSAVSGLPPTLHQPLRISWVALRVMGRRPSYPARTPSSARSAIRPSQRGTGMPATAARSPICCGAQPNSSITRPARIAA